MVSVVVVLVVVVIVVAVASSGTGILRAKPLEERVRIALSVRSGSSSKYSDHLLPSLGKLLMRISSF